MKIPRAWLIAAALVIVLVVAFTLFGKGTLEWYYATQAASALRNGRLERAVVMFEKQLSLSPRDESLRLRLADLLADQGLLPRAEYHLYEGIRQVNDTFELYLKLSEIYIAQDKLYDAQALLSGTLDLFYGVVDEALLSRLRSARPEPPELWPSPGVYGELISVSVTVPEGCVCYISWDGDKIPSVGKDLYTSPKKLDVGVSGFRAITVDSNGLVSDWITGEYHLENVVFELPFKDASVESLVRDALNRPEGVIMSNEVAGLTELVSEEPANYSTLSDLSFFPSLKKLSLTALSGGCDLSELPFLESVTDLRLSGFEIDSVDLDLLEQMTWLKNLSLESNMISDFSPLAALTGLETLDLSANSVLDISPLASMPLLRDFRASQNAIQDLIPMSGLAEIEILILSDNRIKSLDGLSSLSKLKSLDFSRNYVENTSAITGLTALVKVNASSNAIEYLDDFSSLSELTTLDLSSNFPIDSLEPLSGLAALAWLDASGCGLESLSGLGDCVSLKRLEAGKNNITSVEPLQTHPALAELRIEYNRLTTLLPLKDCPKLEVVYAFGNSLTDETAALAGTGINVNWN